MGLNHNKKLFSLYKSSFIYLNAEWGENQLVKCTRILKQAEIPPQMLEIKQSIRTSFFILVSLKKRSAMVAPWDTLDDCGATTIYLHDFLLVIEHEQKQK